MHNYTHTDYCHVILISWVPLKAGIFKIESFYVCKAYAFLGNMLGGKYTYIHKTYTRVYDKLIYLHTLSSKHYLTNWRCTHMLDENIFWIVCRYIPSSYTYFSIYIQHLHNVYVAATHLKLGITYLYYTFSCKLLRWFYTFKRVFVLWRQQHSGQKNI